jgi:hypothetical protein
MLREIVDWEQKDSRPGQLLAISSERIVWWNG